MIRMTVDIDTRRFEAQLRQLSEGQQARAIANALNKTAERARTASVRDITKDFALTATEVRNRLEVRRAYSKGRARIEAGVRIGGKRALNLIRFVEKSVTLAQARKRMRSGEGGTMTLRTGGRVQKALQLRVKVRRQGGWKVIPGAFIGNNGRTVFRRTGKARLPIEPMQTTDVPQLMLSEIGQANFRKAVTEAFPSLLRHEIGRLIKGYGA